MFNKKERLNFLFLQNIILLIKKVCYAIIHFKWCTYMIERINMLNIFEFIDENLKKGYDVYSDVNNINKLMNIIVNWYEVKYPEYIIQMSAESYNKNKSIVSTE